MPHGWVALQVHNLGVTDAVTMFSMPERVVRHPSISSIAHRCNPPAGVKPGIMKAQGPGHHTYMKGAQHRAMGEKEDADRSELAEQSQPPNPVKNFEEERGLLALEHPPARVSFRTLQNIACTYHSVPECGRHRPLRLLHSASNLQWLGGWRHSRPFLRVGPLQRSTCRQTLWSLQAADSSTRSEGTECQARGRHGTEGPKVRFACGLASIRHGAS